MNTTTLKTAVTLMTMAAILVPATAGQKAGPPRNEAALIAVLRSDAERKAKADACRLLAEKATAKAVPVLAALLDDEKLSHMARYALEPIDDPAVDAALREALGRVTGRQLIGVVGSLGFRRDAAAAALIGKYLASDDADLVKVAARSLGRIGTVAAADILEKAMPKKAGPVRLAFCEGLMRCAEALAAGDEAARAAAIYDSLRKLPDAPHQVRAGALRGAVLVRGTEGLPLLLAALRGDDYAVTAAAARAAMEMTCDGVTAALAAELGTLPVDKQVLLTQTMADRGDPAALPALMTLAEKGEKAARIAAIRAIPALGGAGAVKTLLALQKDADTEVAAAAREALGALSGDAVDTAIIAMLKSPEDKTRALGIDLVGRRRMTAAVPQLLKLAGEGDQSVRQTAAGVLADIAGRDHFSALLDLLVGAESKKVIRSLERALAGICAEAARPESADVTIHEAVYGDLPDGKKADVTAKVKKLVKKGTVTIEASNSTFGDPARGTPKKLRVVFTSGGRKLTKTVPEKESIELAVGAVPDELVDELCAAAGKAAGPAKVALLKVLRSTGAPKALGVVRAAATGGKGTVRDEAVGILCEWPTAEALPDVRKFMDTADDKRVKILAFRGAVRMIPLQAAPAAERLAEMKKMFAKAERPEEEKLAVAALGSIASPDALAFAVEKMDDPGLKEVAAIAAVEIGGAIANTAPDAVTAAMKKVVKATKNKTTARNARRILRGIRDKK